MGNHADTLKSRQVEAPPVTPGGHAADGAHRPATHSWMQYEEMPYPPCSNVRPEEDSRGLFLHTVPTAFYRRDSVPRHPDGLQVLDIGCGTGYKALLLALANPSARISAIDASPRCIEIAKEAAREHRVTNIEFYVEDFGALNRSRGTYDYVNVDELAYLVEPGRLLESACSALASDGILRVNYHCKYQRHRFHVWQDICADLGLFDGLERLEAVSRFRGLLSALSDRTKLKLQTSAPRGGFSDHDIANNFLLRGDSGYRIREVFDLLSSFGLHVIGLLDQVTWELDGLFESGRPLPAWLGDRIRRLSEVEALELVERLDFRHRLIDVWCSRIARTARVAPPNWTWQQWESVTVTLNPACLASTFVARLEESLKDGGRLELARLVPFVKPGEVLARDASELLFLLRNGASSVGQLALKYMELHPVDLLARRQRTGDECFAIVTNRLCGLEAAGMIYLSSEGWHQQIALEPKAK